MINFLRKNIKFFKVVEYGPARQRGYGGMLIRDHRCLGIFYNQQQAQQFMQERKPLYHCGYLTIIPKFPFDDFVRHLLNTRKQ